ncbi:lytic murein transglycosylase [Oricola thermophila]|uniref:Lytic murein transglycosylase n=1 Tax=Oricola thermophila TaxID=2742145 RepID=A0A6N1VG82_9HYPH|nr:lytic murein transglycosylase [Oricola thermophila]
MISKLARLMPYVIALTMLHGAPAQAAQCGNNAGGFDTWKRQFAAEAKAKGIGTKGLKALAATRYATKTIAADRSQKSFNYSLDKFMKVRGAATIISQGRRRKAANERFFTAIEREYGVPAGPLLAIHGMETGFGRFMGNANVVSAIATLAYDCRRSDFFTEHLNAALKLVDRGVISAGTKGAMHGEIGHTQFLPANVLKYAVDGDGNRRIDLAGSQWDALASTANFLSAHGWRRGAGYQPGQPNFRAIQGWNAAGVYQKAIAIMAAEIDK